MLSFIEIRLNLENNLSTNVDGQWTTSHPVNPSSPLTFSYSEANKIQLHGSIINNQGDHSPDNVKFSVQFVALLPM